MKNIRNFVIIAHIDHGKSTLADRFLEITQTVEKRRMKDQYLDQLELEKERGITIKMAPVRMVYRPEGRLAQNGEYFLNLIDTPGHPDFSYEVSRALEAVEGAILLVDGTQGIQAQTLSNFYAAKKAGLKIIGAINKVDLNIADIDSSIKEVASLLEVDESEIHKISAKTGFGVLELLEDLILKIPPPDTLGDLSQLSINRALIFDSFYDDHKGIVAVVRVFNGKFQALDEVQLIAAQEKVKIKEVGYFVPEQKKVDFIQEGEIGYIVTGLKNPTKIKIGDTIISSKTQVPNIKQFALPGYKEPKPVVFVSFYPDDPSQYDELKKSLERLRLNDSSFTFEPDFNEVLGRGFKGGFLGKLHFEIISQRLEREFHVKTITSFPSVAYKVKTKHKIKSLNVPIKPDENGYLTILNPKDLPDEYDQILEPMIKLEIICPNYLLGPVLSLKEMFRWEDVETKVFSDKIIINTTMPLSELISDFDDKLKSVSGGFASFSYQEAGFKKADLVRMDILVAKDVVPGLSRILPREGIEREARKVTQILKETLPKQQFPQAIQAKVFGRIIARETIPALKKALGNFGKNGGDRTRKMKLWKKQKEGKKKLLSMAKVKISVEDFKKLLSK
jgi:GTP-binding protein LepA